MSFQAERQALIQKNKERRELEKATAAAAATANPVLVSAPPLPVAPLLDGPAHGTLPWYQAAVARMQIIINAAGKRLIEAAGDKKIIETECALLSARQSDVENFRRHSEELICVLPPPKQAATRTDYCIADTTSSLYLDVDRAMQKFLDLRDTIAVPASRDRYGRAVADVLTRMVRSADKARANSASKYRPGMEARYQSQIDPAWPRSWTPLYYYYHMDKMDPLVSFGALTLPFLDFETLKPYTCADLYVLNAMSIMHESPTAAGLTLEMPLDVRQARRADFIRHVVLANDCLNLAGRPPPGVYPIWDSDMIELAVAIKAMIEHHTTQIIPLTTDPIPCWHCVYAYPLEDFTEHVC